MPKGFTFTLEGTVDDVAELHAAAVKRYLIDFPSVATKEAHDVLGTSDEPDIHACIQMLLDPGIAPDGLSLDNGEVELYGGDDEDEFADPDARTCDECGEEVGEYDATCVSCGAELPNNRGGDE